MVRDVLGSGMSNWIVGNELSGQLVELGNEAPTPNQDIEQFSFAPLAIPVRMKSEEVVEHAKKYFESLTDLVEFLGTPNPIKTKRSGIHSESYNYKVDWYGTSSIKRAKEFAVNGWPEGTKLVEKYTSALIEKLTNRLKIDDYFYDVTGQDFDLDRVLVGEPEAWMQTEQVEVQAPAMHNLKLLVNVGALRSVTSETIMTKGAAIAALVMLLERARRGVEVEVVSYAQSGSQTIEVRMLLKLAGEQLDLGKLAFVLANPSFLRRFVFGVRERVGTGGFKQVCQNENYGSSMEANQGDADLYCGINNGAMYFNSKELAEKWILSELQKQGVELKGDL